MVEKDIKEWTKREFNPGVTTIKLRGSWKVKSTRVPGRRSDDEPGYSVYYWLVQNTLDGTHPDLEWGMARGDWDGDDPVVTWVGIPAESIEAYKGLCISSQNNEAVLLAAFERMYAHRLTRGMILPEWHCK